MYFSKAAVLLSLALSAVALPTVADADAAAVLKRGVLAKQSYAQFQVSDGKAGNALAEVMAKFPIDTNNLAKVDAADLKVIKDARQVAEKAETDGFNPAIEKASGADATALQNGKIKNKVLKLQLEVMALQIDQAANGKDNAAKIKEEQTKLDKNIAQDRKSAGQASKSVQFNG